MPSPSISQPIPPAIKACIETYNEVTGENATPFTMGGGTYARHFPYAVSFGPEHEDMVLPEFGGPMHGANEAAPIDKLLEALKIYIIALLAAGGDRLLMNVLVIDGQGGGLAASWWRPSLPPARKPG